MVNRQSNRIDWVNVSLIAVLSHPLASTAIAGTGVMAIAPVTYAATLTAWQFDASSRQLEITVPQGTTPRYFLLAQPARIVIDLPNTQMGSVSAQQAYTGAVRQIRVSQFEPNTARIVMELAPDVELAAGQVELQPASSSQPNRWVLRPLIAGDSPAIATQPVAPTASLPAVDAAPVESPSSGAPVESPPSVAPTASLPAVDAAPVESPSSGAPVESLSSGAPSATSLPPLEPGGVELPVAPAPAPSPSVVAAPVTPPSAPVEPSASPGPTAAASARIVESPPPPRPDSEPRVAASSVVTADVTDALPPPSFDGAPPVSVSVPPVGQAIAPPQDPALLDRAQRQADGLIAPPATTSSVPAAETPPSGSLSPQPSTLTPVSPPAPAPVEAPAAVEFGQPLPLSSAVEPNSAVAAAPNPNVLLTSGTVLSARYPGGSALELSAGEPWQEVLVLAQPVMDASGRLLFPPGSPVIGQFETGQQGSRFVAQAVSVNGQTIAIQAESEPLAGDRELSQNNILLNSAIGAAAVGVLSGFSGIGLLGGLAAGAATSYFTSPKPAVIEPNQIVQIRLTQDLQRF